MMTMIEMNEKIQEELCDSMEYAKKAVHFKELGDSRKMSMFHEMALDEMKHGNNFIELAREKHEMGKGEISPDLWHYFENEAMEKKEKIQYYLAVLKM